MRSTNKDEIDKMRAAASALKQLMEEKPCVSEQILKNGEDAPPNDLVVDVARIVEVVAALIGLDLQTLGHWGASAGPASRALLGRPWSPDG